VRGFFLILTTVFLILTYLIASELATT
jgi:hypothetical protein